MASHHEVEVTVEMAKDLKNVNWKHGSLRPYVELWFDPASKYPTKVDFNNDDDPVWDEKLVVPFPSHISIEYGILSIDVLHAEAEEDVKPLIGSTQLPLEEVVEKVGIGGFSTQKLKLKRPSGRPHGKLELTACIREIPYLHEVEVKVKSAKNLKNVNWRHGSLYPYAVLWLDPASKFSTGVDVDNDNDPEWDETFTIPLSPHNLVEDAKLSIEIIHGDMEEGVKPLVGSAQLQLQEVVEEVGIGSYSAQTLKVKRPSGRPHGKVKLDVCIHECSHFHGTDAPSHGTISHGSNRDYGNPYNYNVPPPAHGSPYEMPPPQSGYPYQSGDYSHDAPKAKEKKGMGMGAGLAIGAAAGLVGGIALAEGFEAWKEDTVEDALEQIEEDEGDDDE